jgi:hypothetical protein
MAVKKAKEIEEIDMSTVQPYPAGTEWTFQYASKPEVKHVTELVLYAEPLGCWITDDYIASEITPRKLWDRWIANSDIYLNAECTEVHIAWYVTTPSESGHFEGAPFRFDNPMLTQPSSDFLTYFTWPVNTATGEKVNWLRLPVLDRGWNAKHSDKGGFVQELLGWKPAPLQPTMNVQQLAQAAGIV